MITISEALKIIRAETFRLPAENVPLAKIVGRVLGVDILADVDLPPFDRSQMDGFAVKTGDVKNAPVKLQIVGQSAAGRGWRGQLGHGEAVRIMTGAPVPSGADSVQKVELTDEADGFITIQEPTKQDQNIVRKAAEMQSGETAFEKGDIVTENMVATLASFGYANVSAARRPRVSILSTGSEIVEIGEKPGMDQIRNSNSIMLGAFAHKFAEVTILPIVRDEMKNLEETIDQAIQSCELLIISGGVSVGDYDFTKPALRNAGAEILFEKISLKPGKPTVFAKLDQKLIFGLPGNPVSIAVTFFVFVRMALLLMQSANQPELRNGFATLNHPIKATRERDSMLPVSLGTDKTGQLTIETLRFSGSSNFVAFARADGLVFVPANMALEKGSVAQIYFLN